MLQSIRLIAESVVSITDHCIVGIEPNIERISELMEKSLMLVTALAPHIGYDNATRIVKSALKNRSTLREEAVASGFVTEEEFDIFVRPEEMIHPKEVKK